MPWKNHTWQTTYNLQEATFHSLETNAVKKTPLCVLTAYLQWSSPTEHLLFILKIISINDLGIRHTVKHMGVLETCYVLRVRLKLLGTGMYV